MSVRSRNHVQISGAGREALILAHGLGCDKSVWRRILPLLESRYRVVRYDLTGSGRSQHAAYDRERRHAGLSGHAEDLLELCNELDLNRPLFVGHSVGAMIGALAAAREPERFRKLVLIAASPHYIDEPEYLGGTPRDKVEGIVHSFETDYVGTCGMVVPLALGNPDRSELLEELLQSYRSQEARIAAHFTRVVFFSDHRNDLERVTTPSLIVQCTDDAFVPAHVGHFIAGHVASGEFLQLETRGHYPQLVAPQRLGAVLNDYLER